MALFCSLNHWPAWHQSQATEPAVRADCAGTLCVWQGKTTGKLLVEGKRQSRMQKAEQAGIRRRVHNVRFYHTIVRLYQTNHRAV